MTTEEVLDHVYRVQNLVALYGYEIRHWDHAGSVYLTPNNGNLGQANGGVQFTPDFIGKVSWDLETWIDRLKTNKPAHGVR